MDQPGEFFTWRELLSSSAGEQVPDDVARDALRRLCRELLDPLRRAVGPVRVTSGYRTPAHNAKIGGSATSAHVRGLAADIKVTGLSAPEIAACAAALGVDYDQVIWYDPERGGHVHVGLRVGPGRRQLLHAPASGGYRAWRP